MALSGDRSLRLIIPKMHLSRALCRLIATYYTFKIDRMHHFFGDLNLLTDRRGEYFHLIPFSPSLLSAATKCRLTKQDITIRQLKNRIFCSPSDYASG